MKRQVVLTVAESKRLIAKGVASLPEVKKGLEKGVVVVAEGTTNSYVLEELLGRGIDKRRYRSGITTPDVPEKLDNPPEERITGVVFKKGKVDEGADRISIVEKMNRNDVYIKGANVLDYENKTAGILILNPTGGTMKVLSHIIGKKIKLVIPIGLEKLTFEDINECHRLASEDDYEGPSLWPITGRIITEIESLKILTGVEAKLFASGGIAGAEGSVRLLLTGTDQQVTSALKLIDSIKGEPRFLL
jgi:hypothetical protein